MVITQRLEITRYRLSDDAKTWERDFTTDRTHFASVKATDLSVLAAFIGNTDEEGRGSAGDVEWFKLPDKVSGKLFCN